LQALIIEKILSFFHSFITFTKAFNIESQVKLIVMKKIFLILMLTTAIFSSQFSFAQNLVPNPSFEDTIACPFGLAQMDRVADWSSYRESPDYFNYCDTDGFGLSGVPINSWGYQYPRSGNAYSGFGTFDIAYTNSREFIGVTLFQPLIIGKCYRASCYVSRAKTLQPYIDIATNKIGIRFSTAPYSYWNPAPIDNRANVFTDSIITDTTNWVQVTGTFIADSAYQYLSVGNFFTDSLTSWIALSNPTETAYYYVDDVSVYLDSCTDGVPLLNKMNILIFPNPANEYIIIEGKSIQRVSIFDCLGRQLFVSTYKNESIVKLMLDKYSSGIYFLKILFNNHSIEKKINIQKI
jgi:hypothetical protein